MEKYDARFTKITGESKKNRHTTSLSDFMSHLTPFHQIPQNHDQQPEIASKSECHFPLEVSTIKQPHLG